MMKPMSPDDVPKVSEIELPPGVSVEDAEELRDAIIALITGVRDPEKRRLAAERMDRDREELRKRIGETNIAVEPPRSWTVSNTPGT